MPGLKLGKEAQAKFDEAKSSPDKQGILEKKGARGRIGKIDGSFWKITTFSTTKTKSRILKESLIFMDAQSLRFKGLLLEPTNSLF